MVGVAEHLVLHTARGPELLPGRLRPAVLEMRAEVQSDGPGADVLREGTLQALAPRRGDLGEGVVVGSALAGLGLWAFASEARRALW